MANFTRIVHTADWHLGARLVDCDRHEEHRAFLAWLLAQLTELRPDLLIVAGDVFDSATPPQEALTLYYNFLGALTRTVKCRVLVLGGNHDSPATLHAPRHLLRALDIRVVATPAEDVADSILEFEHALVCAAPFLRQRDLFTAEPGQSADAIAAAIRDGIDRHYRTLHTHARERAAGRIVVTTGHLTALGSIASPSERAVYIGNLGAIDAALFDGCGYAALGHIHRAQAVGRVDSVRYVGSPICLSFSEVDCPKEVRVVDISGPTLTHRAIEIPAFRPLLRLTATAATFVAELARHAAPAAAPFPPWIELRITDGRAHPDLDRQVREASAPLNLRILKLLTPTPAGSDSSATPAPARSLAELRPEDVFAERLRHAAIAPDSLEGRELALTFDELLSHARDETPATASARALA